MKTVVVVGLWHLGIVNTIGFAQKGYKVIGIDFDKAVVDKLKKGQPPLYEPGVESKLKQYLKRGSIQFFTKPNVIKDCDWVVIAYDTPLSDRDQASIIPIKEAATAIAPFLQSSTPVIISSQIPVGTAEGIEMILRKRNSAWQSGVVCVPENLRLGQALSLFLKPDFLVLGSNNQQSLKEALKLYKPFMTKKILMDLRSAEMVKHALNTFLALCIGFGNEIALLSARIGVDAVLVTQAIRNDSRIGKAPILPGLGYSGGTLARDVKLLKKFASQTKYQAPLINSIDVVNNSTFDYVISLVEKELGSLKDKTIGILGLTYKPGTDTMRRSPAATIMKKLVTKGAHCIAYDPKASEDESKDYSTLFLRMKDPLSLAANSDVILLLTPWPEFESLNYNRLSRVMKRPVIIDSKNFLDEQMLINSGFKFIGYGRGRRKI